MLPTIRHQDSGKNILVAKLLTGYLKVAKKVEDFESYLSKNGTFDADFVAYVVAWQSNHKLVADGVIGPNTWTAIAENAPTCSTSKNRISGQTLALQVLLDTNVSCDAIYGSRTKSAVATFQDAKNLKSDGVCGPKTWSALIVGSEAKPEPTPTPTPTPGKFVQPVDYKQGDSRWGKKMYSNHNDKSQTMANSGCGPTAMADVVATLKDPKITPYDLALLAVKWGDRTRSNGTSWSFFPHVAEHFHFVKMVQTKSFDALKACLDAGGYVVCSMAPGYWTKSGHFICAWKYDGTYVYCNDPASNSRKNQKISAFKSESKQYFCFYPDPPKVEQSPVDNTKDIQRGEKICDISHHQPDVNYDEFIRDTALIILRPGYRGTGGSVKQDTCFVKHADALKARGVRFGTSFYSIARTVEQAQEEARMYYKWAKDYDPLFWAMDAEKEEITTAAIVAFVDELRKLGAKKVGCYVANHLYNKYDFSSIADQMNFVWIPRYGFTKPVHKCDLWQYTSTGSVDGISGNVDLDRITGDGHDLKWFTEG